MILPQRWLPELISANKASVEQADYFGGGGTGA
jgi:hypothetical protein